MKDTDQSDLAHALFEESGDALFLFDPETEQVLQVNPVAERLTGLTRARLLQTPALSLFRYEAAGGQQRLRQAARNTGVFHSQEGYLLRTFQDGVWVPVNLTITRLHVKPKTLGLITARDVREQREAHARLKKMEADLRQVMDSVSDCLWSGEIDARGQLTYRYFSPVVEKITGRPAGWFQASVNRWWSVVHPEDRDRWVKALGRLRGGQASVEEYRVVWPDGRERWVRESVQVTPEPGGQLLRLDGVVADVTERKGAEEALRSSEQRLSRILETTLNGIILIDAHRRIVFANASAEKILGLTRNELLDRTWSELFLRDEDQTDGGEDSTLGRAMRFKQSAYGMERWITRPDGSRAILSVNAAMIQDGGGRVTGAVLAFHDVTRAKEAQQALRQSEERFRALVENSSDVVTLLDAQGRITYTTTAVTRVLGYPPDEFVGRVGFDFIHPDDLAGVRDQFERCLASPGTDVPVQARCRHRDGSWRHIEGTIDNRLNDPNVRAVIVNYRDITPRKLAEEQLHRTNETLRALIDSSPLAIIALDREGIVRGWNPAAERMFGWSEGEILGEPSLLAPPDRRDESQLLRAKALAGESFTEVETVRRRKDGSLIDVSISAAPLFDEHGAVGGIMAVMADVSARRRAEEARRASEERYRLLFERNLAGVFRTTPDGRILACNEAFARVFGYASRDEILAHSTHELYFDPADRVALLSELRQRGTLANYECRLRKKDGSPVWVLENVSLLEGEDGGPVLEGTVVDLSERKRAEEALRQSQRQYEDLVNTIDGIVWECDARTFQFTFVSQDAERLLGYPVGQWLTEADFFPNHIHAEDRDRVIRYCLEETKALRNHEMECRMVAADGHEVWVRDIVTVVAEGGVPVQLRGLMVDVTEAKLAEHRLAESEERYRLLAENATDLINRSARDLTCLYASPACRALLGYEPSELIGRSLDQLVHPDDLAQMRQTHASPDHLPASNRLTYRARRKDGTYVWVETALQVVRDPQTGAVGEMIGVTRDVTERKQAEAELARQHALLRGLIDSIPDLIFYKDRRGVYLGCNRAFEEYAGRKEKDLLGLTDLDLFPPQVGAGYRERDRAVLADGQAKRNEEWLDYPDGRRVLVEVLKTPFFGPDGSILGLIGVSRDITERRRLEEQLRQAGKMEAVGQLAGGVAHEFNNMLTAILGNTSMLLAGAPPGSPSHEMLTAVERSGWRAAELTSQLLGFSRRTPLRLEAVDLNACVAEVVTILRRAIDPRIAIAVEAAEGLWAVQADPTQMNQILLNLCLNARDAMPAGGRLVVETAKVALDEAYARAHLQGGAGEFVRLRVADTGAGIAPEVRGRIFEPFFTTKGPGQGTGLGLAMVFGIVQQHRGWVECDSEVGRGTRFDIYLPRHHPEPKETPAAPTGPAVPGGTETILLADDEPVIRNLGRTILTQYGYEVLLAEDGERALELFTRERGRVGLVILDLTMPKVSGRDALRELLRIDPEVRVLFSSGYTAEQLSEAEREGVRGFVNKPYRPQELARIVRAVLDQPAEVRG